MNTQEHLNNLRELLLLIPNKLVTNEAGLCYNYAKIFDYEIDKIFENEFYPIYKQWEHYSGNSEYPIPVTDDIADTPNEQYWLCAHWQGKQLKLRIELVKFIIAELEKES